jgi:hypothetical protein
MRRKPMADFCFRCGPQCVHRSALSQDHVIVAVPDINVARKQKIHDSRNGIEQGRENRSARPHLRIARALMFPVDHLKTVGAGEVLEIRKRNQRVEVGRKRRLARLAGLFFAAHIAVEPDVEPVRGVSGDDAGKRFRIRRADQDQAALPQRFAEAEKGCLDVGEMLNDVVADHEIEAAGREPIGLDVAENRLLRIVIVTDLVLIDIDRGRKLVEPPPAS